MSQLSLLEQFDEAERGSLPNTVAEGIRYCDHLLTQFNSAMLAKDGQLVQEIAKDCDDLAIHFNDGERMGVAAGDHGPQHVFARATKFEGGAVPTWGRVGEFLITVAEVPVLCYMHGVFGMGSPLSFDIFAPEGSMEFFSKTGYRSMSGPYWGFTSPGMTVKEYAAGAILAHFKRSKKEGGLAGIYETPERTYKPIDERKDRHRLDYFGQTKYIVTFKGRKIR